MLMDRDLRLLKFMSGFSFMVSEQCAKYLGVSEVIVRRRLRRLVELELVEAENVLGSRRLFYRVSRAGLVFLGVAAEGSMPKGVRIGQMEHDKVVVDLAVDFAVANPDFEVIGEAQIRRLDGMLLEAGDEPEFAVKRVSGGRLVNVFPDVVAVSPAGHRFFLEFEHSLKDKKRLKSLMRGYILSEKVSAVKYFGVPAVMPRLQAAVSELSGEMPLFGGKPKIQVEEIQIESGGLLA